MSQRCYLCSRKRDKINNIILHNFPSDEEIRKKWVRVCRINPTDCTKYTRICSAHFSLQDYKESGEFGKLSYRLKRTAVPSLKKAFPKYKNKQKTRHDGDSTFELRNENGQHHFDEPLFTTDISHQQAVTAGGANGTCRTCRSEFTEKRKLRYIYNAFTNKEPITIANLLIRSIPGIVIKHNDELPKTICLKCLKKLIRLADFQKLCLKSQNEILALIESTQTNTGETMTESIIYTENTLQPQTSGLQEKTDVNVLQSNVCFTTKELKEEPELKQETSYDALIEIKKERDYSEDEMCEYSESHIPTQGNSLKSIESVCSQQRFDDTNEFTESAIEFESATMTESIMYTENILLPQTSGLQEKTDVNVLQSNECFTTIELKEEPELKQETSYDAFIEIKKERDSSEDEMCEYSEFHIPTEGNSVKIEFEPEKFTVPNISRNTLTANIKQSMEKELGSGITPVASKRVCKYCDKGFNKRNSLLKHIRKYHIKETIGSNGEKCYECPGCPKIFHNYKYLHLHKKVHEDTKRFTCDLCDAAFLRADSLKIHKLIHSKKRPFKCNHCDYSFSNPSYLKAHQRIHTGKRVFKCKYCAQTFVHHNSLVMHLRKSFGENIYSCELCPQRFPRAKDAREHFGSHKHEDETTRVRNLNALKEEEAQLAIRHKNYQFEEKKGI